MEKKLFGNPHHECGAWRTRCFSINHFFVFFFCFLLICLIIAHKWKRKNPQVPHPQKSQFFFDFLLFIKFVLSLIIHKHIIHHDPCVISSVLFFIFRMILTGLKRRRLSTSVKWTNSDTVLIIFLTKRYIKKKQRKIDELEKTSYATAAVKLN